VEKYEPARSDLGVLQWKQNGGFNAESSKIREATMRNTFETTQKYLSESVFTIIVIA